MSDMTPILRLITIAVYDGNDFTEGDRFCAQLGWDEMLGQVVQLTAPNPSRLYPMLTEEEHAEKRRRHEERMAALARESEGG